jgi:OOP family OmpA-OmpF porin
MGRWLIAIIVLLGVGLVHGLMTAQSRIDDMTANIQSDLMAAGYDWATVSMSGNVARISGEAATTAEQQAAIQIAKDARCSVCKPKHKWHNVVDETSLLERQALPTQSPYTFSARKSADGNVTLSGYAPSESVRDGILQNAVSSFGNDNVAVDRIDLADGAPDTNWGQVVQLYLSKLSRLDEGRLVLEDKEGALQGRVSSLEAQEALYADMMAGTPEGYNLVGNVSVPGTPIRVLGQSASQSICQGLLDDLRRGRKIGFQSGEAVIRGDDNFDLLGDLASAANQCPDFRIAINGYTSSDGNAELNQTLSEDRANAVLFYLSEQGGIDRTRLTARGFGSQNPIASNETPEGREQNRRIEFIVSSTE